MPQSDNRETTFAPSHAAFAGSGAALLLQWSRSGDHHRPTACPHGNRRSSQTDADAQRAGRAAVRERRSETAAVGHRRSRHATRLAAEAAHPGRPRGAARPRGVLCLAESGLLLNTISTDDAYVNGHVTFVAPRVPGQVAKVLVDDNYRVKKGDVLVQLDPEPYQIMVEIKQAAVAIAEADLVAATAQVHGFVGQAPRQSLQSRVRDRAGERQDRHAASERGDAGQSQGGAGTRAQAICGAPKSCAPRVRSARKTSTSAGRR